jgi:hypothetical protein
MPNSAPASFSGTPSSFQISNAPFSPNQPAASLGTIHTSGLHQNNGMYHNPGYFLNSPIPSYAAQVSPTNVPGKTSYFLSNGANVALPSTTHVAGNVALIVPPSVPFPGSAEYFAITSDPHSTAHPGSSCMDQSESFSVPVTSSANASNLPASHQNSDSSQDPLGHHSQHLLSEENKDRLEHSDVAEKSLEVPRTQPAGEPTSPVPNRKLTMQRKMSRKFSVTSRQQSKSSGDEAPNLTPPAAHKHSNVNPPSSPGAGRRKLSRKVSCTNSIGSHHNVDNSINESSAGSTGGPNATSSPNAKHRTSVVHHR